MLLIVGSVGVLACYSGFERLVENFLDDENASINVYCSSKK
jgi:hypothetical protein